jgi:putative tricarboxylic transport membrane protein
MNERDHGRTRPPFGRAEQEVVTAAVLLGVFAYLRYYLPVLIVGRRGGAYVDPDFWPGWLLNVALVFAAAYLVQSVRTVLRERAAANGAAARARTLARPAAPGEAEDEHTGLHEVALSGNLLKLTVGFALLWAYIFSLSIIGFVPSTAAFSVAFLLFLGERRPVAVVGFPVALLAVLLYVFTRLLVVPLPRGVGPFLEFSTYFY